MLPENRIRANLRVAVRAAVNRDARAVARDVQAAREYLATVAIDDQRRPAAREFARGLVPVGIGLIVDPLAGPPGLGARELLVAARSHDRLRSDVHRVQ